MTALGGHTTVAVSRAAMDTLSAADLLRLLKVLPELYRVGDLESYQEQVLKVVPRLISCEITSYNELDARGARGVWRVDPPDAPVEAYSPFFELHMPEHPLLQHYATAKTAGTLKITDVVSQRSFRELGIYSEFFRPLRTEYQLVAPLPTAGPRVVGVALSRGRRDFDERERTLLDLLRPHLAQARANAAFVSALRLPPPIRSKLGTLTARELQVLAEVAAGRANKEIARSLAVSPLTVRAHLEHIFEKLDVASRTQAASLLLGARDAGGAFRESGAGPRQVPARHPKTTRSPDHDNPLEG